MSPVGRPPHAQGGTNEHEQGPIPHVYFTDLQTIYDSVDRTLMREVTGRSGVPPRMTKVIHTFHDGMRAQT